MVYAYIGVALLVILLIVFVALAVRWLTGRVTLSIREHSIDLLSGYDSVLEEKGRELKAIQDEIAAAEKDPAVPEKPVIPAGSTADNSGDSALKAVERVSASSYRDPAFAELYRKVRTSVPVSPDAILEAFRGKDPEKGPAGKILSWLDADVIYRLSLLDGAEQYQLLSEVLDEDEKALLDDYAAGEKSFNAIGFYDRLRTEADTEPGPVRLTVAPYMADVSYPSWVEVETDSDIIEGFMIEKDNIRYDYSIKGREIS